MASISNPHRNGGLLISRRRLPIDRPTKHQLLRSSSSTSSFSATHSRASRDRREIISRLAVREIGREKRGAKCLPRFSKRSLRSMSMPELSSNNSETSIGNCARNEEEEKQVLRARKRLREKEELKRQIAEDLRAIDKLKKQREKTKEEAKRRLFQKEREQRAQGLEQWKRQREEQRQRQLRALKQQRDRKLKLLEKARVQRQELYSQYLKKASLHAKQARSNTQQRKPKARPQPVQQDRDSMQPSQKLPPSIFQLAKQGKKLPGMKARAASRPVARKKQGFQSDSDIERLARDIVHKASLQNQIFRLEEQPEENESHLAGPSIQAELSLEIPLETSRDAELLQFQDNPLPTPLTQQEELLSAPDDSLPAASTFDEVVPHEEKSPSTVTLPAVAEIERWYEEQLKQL